MATTKRNQQITTIEVTKAELRQLLGAKAKEAGLIDFDPDTVSVFETDPVLGKFEIVFEREIIPAAPANPGGGA